jgi:predicted metal-dependent HD superfamily phosphohydrolase
MSWPGPDRWLRLWRTAGASKDGARWYEKLMQAYAEPQRHYHNHQHISECLAEFDRAQHLARQPVAVEFAVWFHDAVYDPKASDNEERSAAMATDCLEEIGLSHLAAAVSDLVMATKSHNTDTGPDAGLMVDVDLSILGKGDQRFAEYEAQIRDEYRWVPPLIFKSKRAEILQRFLDREQIYTTKLFAAQYEEIARRNLERSIQQLRGVRDDH